MSETICKQCECPILAGEQYYGVDTTNMIHNSRMFCVDALKRKTADQAQSIDSWENRSREVYAALVDITGEKTKDLGIMFCLGSIKQSFADLRERVAHAKNDLMLARARFFPGEDQRSHELITGAEDDLERALKIIPPNV